MTAEQQALKQRLEAREEALIRMYDWMDEETDMQVVANVHRELAEVQTALYALGAFPTRDAQDACRAYDQYLARGGSEPD